MPYFKGPSGRLRKAAHQLAMLALQSVRYRDDMEYRQATDDVLEFTVPLPAKEAPCSATTS